MLDFPDIRAVLFDMDGTLINSEQLSDRAISAVLAEAGISSQGLDLFQFHGIAWQLIAPRLKALYPTLDTTNLAESISARFNHLLETETPPLLPGAQQAFIEAAAVFPVAITTGSGSAAVEDLLDRADLRQHCRTYCSCDMYRNSKPHPEPYIKTAAVLGVAPQHCLVFEDSLPGLSAAKNAGMSTIGVSAVSETELPTDLADAQIRDYTQLPQGYFRRLSSFSPISKSPI
jgi:mannitol-1-/sugar-/sorbitol-6-/2-deoxyglucose-6-phosphatase